MATMQKVLTNTQLPKIFYGNNIIDFHISGLAAAVNQFGILVFRVLQHTLVYEHVDNAP